MEYFLFFVAEDIAREQLVKLLQEAFPNAVVDAVENVEDGLKQLKQAQQEGIHYDIALLDFKLPRREGENPEVDESLCLQVRLDPETLIGHITGFADDPEIKAHLNKVHPPGDRKGFIIDKRETSWPTKLITEMRQYLYGYHIERQIRRVFGRAGESSLESAHSSRFGSGPRPLGSLTNAIADLCLDISLYWKDLHPAVQERITQYFDVDATGTDIKVTPR